MYCAVETDVVLHGCLCFVLCPRSISSRHGCVICCPSFLLPLGLIQHLNPLPVHPSLLQCLRHRILLRALNHNFLYRVLRATAHQLTHARGARTSFLQFLGQRLRTDVENFYPGQLGDGLVTRTCLQSDLDLGSDA